MPVEVSIFKASSVYLPPPYRVPVSIASHSPRSAVLFADCLTMGGDVPGPAQLPPMCPPPLSSRLMQLHDGFPAAVNKKGLQVIL